ncbi:MAG TPA: nuclear transport factor 2 family protein [Yeosuana sp.]
MKKEIAKQYIEFLSKDHFEGIIGLFEENGKVYSPIYGERSASDFYDALAEDTCNSELKLNEIFENINSGNIALYFTYRWTLKSGKIVVFDVVDIIKFDDQNKILELKIIYDTVVSRNLVEELKK